MQRSREDAAEFLEDNIKLDGDTSPGTHFLLTQMAREAKFFEALGNSNAAQVRDFLVHNRASLAEYTRTLDDKWRAIVENGNKLQSEEKLHDEMLATTRKIVGEFVVVDRTVKEKLAYMAQFPLLAASRSRTRPRISSTCPMAWVRRRRKRRCPGRKEPGLARGQSGLHGPHRQLQGTAAGGEGRCAAAVQGNSPRGLRILGEEQGGRRARLDGAIPRIAREPVVGTVPDARAAGRRQGFLQGASRAHGKALQGGRGVAREFEDKWTGVFKGPLAPRTIDELVNSTSGE